MEKEIAEGAIGTVGHYDLAFKEGKLSLKLGMSKDLGLISVKSDNEIGIPARAVMEAIKAAIPGHFEDGLLDAAVKLLEG